MARIGVLCADLARNPLYTPWMFGGALAFRHEVKLVGPRPTEVWAPAKGEVDTQYVLPGRSPFVKDVRAAALELTQEADLLYAFKAWASSFGLGLWLRRRLEVPLAVHLCDWDGGYFSETPTLRRAWYAMRTARNLDNELYFRAFEHLTSRADLLTVSTRSLQRRFGGSVVRQGVDADRFSPARFPRREARERLGIDPDTPVTVFVGTPAVHKGLAELILTFRELGADGGALLIVGTPPDEESRRILSEARSARVECRPSVSFSEVPWYLAAADVFCVPQRATAYAEHQLPAKILYAMALGACVLTTDVGDAREILGGEPAAGLVVPASDSGALKEAIETLLADSCRREALGKEARNRAQDLYSWRAMSAELNRLFRGVGIE